MTVIMNMHIVQCALRLGSLCQSKLCQITTYPYLGSLQKTAIWRLTNGLFIYPSTFSLLENGEKG